MPLSRKPLPDSRLLPGKGGKENWKTAGRFSPLCVPRGQLRAPLHYVQGRTYWSQGSRTSDHQGESSVGFTTSDPRRQLLYAGNRCCRHNNFDHR